MPRIVRALLIVLAAASATPAGAQDSPAGAGESIAGKLLVAAPSMPDPRFAGTVIYICVHGGGGAFGLVVNRRLGLVPGTEVAARLGIDAAESAAPVALHRGGPVAPGRGFILHTADYASVSTVPVADGIAFSVDEAAVADLVAGQGAERALFAFGYAGWSPGQLEGELARDDWLVVSADSAFLFDRDPETMWQAALDRMEIAL